MRHHVIVVGGGFAGIACVNRLAGEPRVRVTLVDRNGYHQFQPLLYQVASAELAADDIRFDLRELYGHHDNVDVRTDEVIAVDPAAPSVTFADGETLGADAVVLAAGARPNFFHTLGADVHAYPLYSLEDAVRLRSRILQLFKDTAQRPELAARGSLTFVVVGGGPTGVETAGALAELVHEVMPRAYSHLSSAPAQVVLVDLAPGVLRRLLGPGARVRRPAAAAPPGPPAARRLGRGGHPGPHPAQRRHDPAHPARRLGWRRDARRPWPRAPACRRGTAVASTSTPT